ncbi:MAG: NAD+ synthase [Gammaproteobacteria bacterium]|nr:NAD+ synthase [Gammaproteobacteria bacterium]
MSGAVLRLALAQLNLLVGDIAGNAEKIRVAARRAQQEFGADLVICPELALSGYPPEDLLFHRGFRRQIGTALERFAADPLPTGVLFGYPEYAGTRIFNAAALFDRARLQATHRKACLPNYKVFDEKRYFEPGGQPAVADFRGFRLGLLICEDIWEPEPAQLARSLGAEVLLVINASPFEIRKQLQRETVLRERIADVGLPIVYVNLVGGQDELVFDGQSFVMNAAGEVVARAGAFAEDLLPIEFARAADGAVCVRPSTIAPLLDDTASVYQALVLGVRDYVTKHRFPGVVLGLSGGIDSALTLAIAVDALGADKVHAVMMPSRYTAAISEEDAAREARTLGVRYSTISIEGMFEAALAALRDEFAGLPVDTTEENIQSRCRMLILMGLSNKTGRMLLTTGNKSEMAVGYATLYGDMAGGFAPIKDCSKTQVYRLAEYRNSLGEVIPRRVIERPPSAELRPNQKDTDSLPEYPVLDAILEAFIEEDLSVDEIVARGYDKATVGRVLDLVKRNEYKRRQAPPGVRVSRRAFGRDWRYPITNGYRR